MKGIEKSNRAASRAGLALVPTLIVVVGLLGLSMALLNHTSSVTGQVSAEVDDQRARLLADAGLAEAVTSLRAGASGAIAAMDRPARIGDGLFWVEAQALDNGDVRLDVHAMAGAGRASAALVVRPSGAGDLFRATLNSRETLTLDAVGLVDSYDSTAGSYASQAIHSQDGVAYANTDGDVLSAMDIVMEEQTFVFGDAVPGPDHAVSMTSTSYVHGSTAPGAAEFDFPVIETPSFGSQGPKTVSGSESLGPGSYEFDCLVLDDLAELTVEGPATFVVASFQGGADARLLIDAAGGPVTIYCQDYLHGRGFEALPVDDSPLALAFFITGESDVVFPAESQVRGAYYADKANIVFNSRSEAWGSFIANRIDLTPGMSYHYDEALAQYWEGGNVEGAPLALVARFDAPSPPLLTSKRADPFDLLGVDPEQCPTPAEAWTW